LSKSYVFLTLLLERCSL